jgi:hypothetical protein
MILAFFMCLKAADKMLDIQRFRASDPKPLALFGSDALKHFQQKCALFEPEKCSYF